MTDRPRTLNFITGNANKLAEVRAILGGPDGPVEVQSKSLEIDEIQGTIDEIAKEKCRRAAEAVWLPNIYVSCPFRQLLLDILHEFLLIYIFSIGKRSSSDRRYCLGI